MKRHLFFKIASALFVVLILCTWTGQIFDNDEIGDPNSFDALPVFIATDGLFVNDAVFTRIPARFFSPLLPTSFAAYLEMREKSPPLSPILF